MRFVSAPMRAKYVMRSAHKVMNGPTPMIVPGIKARFYGHVFDSEKSQRELGWTDQERTELEEYLMGHKDFNRHGGFYLESTVDTVPAPTSTRCIAFFRNEQGESEQCGREPVSGSDYCDEHKALMAAGA